MKRHLRLTFATVVCLSVYLTVVTGCKKDGEPEPEATTGAEVPEVQTEAVAVEAVEEPCIFETVYFALDSSELDSSARAAIQSAVDCYRNQNPDVRILLTGACDPRGTEEYNVALGESRAQAVRSYMSSLGLGARQIAVSSVGEEMATGSDEAGWARDRNVSGSVN